MAVRSLSRVRVTFQVEGEADQILELGPQDDGFESFTAGAHLHYVLLRLRPERDLPIDSWIAYRLELRVETDNAFTWVDHNHWAPDLCYPGQEQPGFRIVPRVQALLHGSCRKPHHGSGDGLVQADRLLAEHLSGEASEAEGLHHWPSFLVMSGDQIYADDVAGPMLRAIHQVADHLGLDDETLGTLESVELTTAAALYQDEDTYYRREKLLPVTGDQPALWEVVFGGALKPVFTTDTAHNHLITLAEVLAMYMLCWSPAGWSLVELDEPPGLTPDEKTLYQSERNEIEDFAKGLSAVRRLFAHIPVAMMFDDHDITDDWNLNRDWEETAYGHPFSRRILGNALIGYFLNQGWGNSPETFPVEMKAAVAGAFTDLGSPDHDKAIDEVLAFEGWDFSWPTAPALVALDTRTRRWRSESSGQQPSGLLDWEALTDLQRTLREKDEVLLVSAAPVYGVKLIEAIQRFFTMIGKPLMVDAEYWMAHPGTAHGILNVFRHRKTPERFTILSGDVHYSFVFDVEIRGRTGGPKIWQICSSGLRNEFPDGLLDKLDRFNRFLYAPGSILNLLTKRRRMRVIPRKPEGLAHGRRLLNASGIGLVEFDEAGSPVRIGQVLADRSAFEARELHKPGHAGKRFIPFRRREGEAVWD